MPAPHSRTCWSMRCPSDETNHLRVSQIWYRPVARSAPDRCASAVAPTSRSPLSDKGTPSGSTWHSLAQVAVPAGTGTRSAVGPATEADAAAIAAARSPAARTAPSPSSGTAKKPHPEPTSARTPSPASSAWVSSSTSPLSADIDSYRRCITRASAYRAPAASAASTAAVAASNSLIYPRKFVDPAGEREVLLRHAAGGVGGQAERYGTPADVDIRMVVGRLG